MAEETEVVDPVPHAAHVPFAAEGRFQQGGIGRDMRPPGARRVGVVVA